MLTPYLLTAYKPFENYFINEGDVIDLITNGGENRLVGESFDDLNLKAIETELLQTKFIQNAEVYKDLKGTLMIIYLDGRICIMLLKRFSKTLNIGFALKADEFEVRV